jgi:cytochrome c-type biogenesis protein CcmH/NrfG
MLNMVFVGNCQIENLFALYGKFVGPHVPTNRTYIASYTKLNDKGRSALRDADVVVNQVSGFRSEQPLPEVQAGVKIYNVPVVTGGFLWPFSGKPHPSNAPVIGYPNGPYPAPNGDSYLNRLIREGMGVEEAVDAYMRLDIGQEVDLDRAYDMIMSKLRKTGQETGYDVADIIERYFREEALFRSPYHPEARITNALAATLFQQMGVGDVIVDRVRRQPNHPSFRGQQLPIHPAVVRHFGLRFVRPDRRYRFMNDGYFTIQDWAGRYMRYEWNDALETGIHLAPSITTLAEALEKLGEGLTVSPGSAIGWYTLAGVHQRARRYDEAMDAIVRSIEIEPIHAGGHAVLGRLLELKGERKRAVAAFQEAVRLDPFNAPWLRSMGRILRVLGRGDEAGAALRLADDLDPGQAPGGNDLVRTTPYGRALASADDHQEA